MESEKVRSTPVKPAVAPEHSQAEAGQLYTSFLSADYADRRRLFLSKLTTLAYVFLMLFVLNELYIINSQRRSIVQKTCVRFK